MEKDNDVKQNSNFKENNTKKNLKKSEVNKIENKTVIYMGPSIPGKITSTGKIYKNIPKYIADFISKNPVIGKLFINVEDLPSFKKNIQIKGTIENSLYSQAVNIINERGVL